MGASTNYESQNDLEDELTSIDVQLLVLLESATPGREKMEGDLHQIDAGRATALTDEKKRDAKRKSRSLEGRAIRKRNAADVSRMTAPRTVTYVRRPIALRHPPLAYVECINSMTRMEYVGGHPVRATIAPMVRRIFAKHGNIASNVPYVRHPEITAVLFEVVCDVVKKIVQDDFHTVLADLEETMVLAPVAQMGEIDTSWLEKALAELDEIRNLTIKAAAKDFDAKKKMMMMAKNRFKKVQRSLLDQEF
ncbi:hypothetical protein Salat_0002000 [Sesamum alatum]|uniref:Uncharacterized protein n=1 Tax=Sesamum alatum TaxID=300844 RepID=A0AAE1YVT6_9LAMI|nr:hypothetical protein Salat_0002000 [Sesamum alatum]